ncbi:MULTISPECIES: inositol-3-phosphate synthase [Acidianus]|uniref:L-myo-inositol-1-phosphate synthase n=1 Tax=Candidatus Acidianus copahuensis TaxID=1160895 RepID=A0A031LPQ6_9CREN|nr:MULTISPECIES: L-myo-inositol-1-phosphate synthase [Acidianus]EZQ06986.1 L-myo-inositol-1-phosphate synthase [Candidatus Acidianus copahuensis]NON61987.1 L-myo-inositol-1-phosphate synthase [Acidianus sp. RZ1]
MIRVAIIGVGNVASAFLQGLEMVKVGVKINGTLDLPISFHEIDVVAAFDVDKRKVGKKLSEAIFQKPNVVPRFFDVKSDVTVLRGPTLDSLDVHLSQIIDESEESAVDVVDVLKGENVDVVLNLLPVGSDKASLFYSEQSLESGSSFINVAPSPIVELMGDKYTERKIPLFGDDLLSQIGGTALHSGLIEFLQKRGVKVLRSYQVDIGGNTETYATLEENRKDLKKKIKSSFISGRSENAEIVAGTSDYVEFLGDRRVSYMVIEGEYGLGNIVRIDVSMKSLDGPNAVQPLLDLVRLSSIARIRNIGGPIPEICGTYFKNSKNRYSSIDEAKRNLMEWLKKVMIEPRSDT